MPAGLRPLRGRRFWVNYDPVVSSLALLNHWLMAFIPPGCCASRVLGMEKSTSKSGDSPEPANWLFGRVEGLEAGFDGDAEEALDDGAADGG